VPTFLVLPRFRREYAKLTPEQAAAFRAALAVFLEGLASGTFHPGLRIHRIEGTLGVWSLTWAPDGRATFEYGQQVRPGEPHIVWRRIGDQSIYRRA
jgi:hypothetical protein